jgi:hypothetical protein
VGLRSGRRSLVAINLSAGQPAKGKKAMTTIPENFIKDQQMLDNLADLIENNIFRLSITISVEDSDDDQFGRQYDGEIIEHHWVGGKQNQIASYIGARDIRELLSELFIDYEKSRRATG